jgi:hypothetical protein
MKEWLGRLSVMGLILLLLLVVYSFRYYLSLAYQAILSDEIREMLRHILIEAISHIHIG